MLDLKAALEHKQISEPVQRVVLAAAQQTSCQPLDRSRDGKSVPCVAEQGTQVALYPMKHRIAIAMDAHSAPAWGTRLGARLEEKNRRTTYLHLFEDQLRDPAVASAAVEAAVESLVWCREHVVGARGSDEAPALRDFGLCLRHHLARVADGRCPGCQDEDER